MEADRELAAAQHRVAGGLHEGQRHGIAGGQFRVLRFFGEINDSLRPQYDVEMLVKKHFRQRDQSAFI